MGEPTSEDPRQLKYVKNTTPQFRTEQTSIRILTGATAILEQSHLLESFAAACAQPAAMNGLRLKLEHEYVRRKLPHLAMVQAPGVGSASRVEDLRGCVLFFEYRIAGWRSGFFATGDDGGIGTVIAPAADRAFVASFAMQALLRHGRLALATWRSAPTPAATPAPATPDGPSAPLPAARGLLWARRSRPVRDTLVLAPTYGLTLESLGKRTRTHLRYYRRRTQAETGCVFHSDAARHIRPSELAALNRASRKPISQRAFDLQFESTANAPGGFVSGLRASSGRWLSLAGGWRQDDACLLQWQMNSAGFGSLSLSTALRAFLIEQEVALGMRRLCFHGGTSHSISHSFLPESVEDLLLRRPGPLPSAFVALLSRLPHLSPAAAPLLDRGNFLIEALRGGGLDWM